MKYSKKQAMKFAVYEEELREPDWEPPDDDPDWTLADQIKQEGAHEGYSDTESVASAIATMMFDGIIESKEDIKKAKKFYGKMLWEKAVEKYISGDHST